MVTVREMVPRRSARYRATVNNDSDPASRGGMRRQATNCITQALLRKSVGSSGGGVNFVLLPTAESPKLHG